MKKEPIMVIRHRKKIDLISDDNKLKIKRQNAVEKPYEFFEQLFGKN